MKRAVLIAGATASGKSAVALDIAKARGGTVINADAMQVYHELRILTARPTPDDEAAAPHVLFGHVPARETYSAARWLHDAKNALSDAWRDNRIPIVTGGTGLYFRSLEQGLADIPAIAPAIRERWREALLSKGSMHLHGILKRMNQGEAERLDPADGQRVVRALEVLEATGRSLSEWQAEAQMIAPLAGVEIERIFLDIPRDVLYARAEARFDMMVGAGAVEEVRQLLSLALDSAMPAMKAIGVPELAAYLRNEIPCAEAVERAKTATRRYIKRQLTWWRHQMPEWPHELTGLAIS